MPLLNIAMPVDMYFDSDGTALENGYIYIGEANKNPEVFPISVYWDSELTIPVAQPIRTLNGFPSNNGRPGNLYADAISCSIITKDKNGSLVLSDLDFTGLGGVTNVIQLVSSKAVAQTISPTTTRDLFIQGNDGGQFYGVTGAAPGTYTDDGGSYCGTTILPTGGDGSSAWIRSKYRAGEIDGEWFGMQLDGTDDATELTNAATFLKDSYGGGTLNIRGDFTASAITWPAFTKWFNLKWFGTWTTTAKISVPNYVCLNGQGGYSGTQFATSGPVAHIVASGSVDPVVEITGSGRHALKNFAITGVTDVGIKPNGYSSLGALLWMENVHVNTANVSTTEIPLNIESFFWVWAKSCTFLSYTNSGPSVLISQTSGRAAGSYPGLIYFDDCIINAQGVHMTCSQASSSVSSYIYFNRMTYENCEDPFLTIDTSTTNNIVSHIAIRQLCIADKLAGYTSLIKTTGNFNTIRNISIDETPMITGVPIVDGTRVFGLSLRSSEETIDYGTGFEIGQEIFTGIIADKLFGEIKERASDMSPSLLPYNSLNLSQDISTYSNSGSTTVNSNILAPDGSLTAYEITDSAGVGYRYKDLSAITLAVGDYILFGFWCKSTTPGAPPYYTSHINATSSAATFESTNSSLEYVHYANKDLFQVDMPWTPVVEYGKISAIGTQPTTLRLMLATTLNQNTAYWKPWVMHLPATLGFDEQDIARLKKQLANVPPNVGSEGDVVAMHDNHRLRLGGTGVMVYSATAAPTTKIWVKGDFVHNSNPTVDGNSMILIGWICTVSGGPGTWQACYASNVSPAV